MKKATVEPRGWYGSASGIAVIVAAAGALAGQSEAQQIWNEQAKLTAADAGAGDIFGFSVSVSGDTALVSAWRDDDGGADSGSAYVFTRIGATWTEQAKLTASDGEAGDQFGYSVSVSGDTALIGTNLDNYAGAKAGSTYVFQRVGTAWTEQARLTAIDAVGGEEFGYSVSICGDIVVIGAVYDDVAGAMSGSAYVFRRSGTTWVEEAKLTASDGAGGDWFGHSVSIYGDTALVGARYADESSGVLGSGAAYVFSRTGTSWSQQAKLTASDAAVDDEFGYAVSLLGETAVIGAIIDDEAGAGAGSAYVFLRSGTVWAEQAKLLASDASGGDNFGIALSVSADTTVVGARGTNTLGLDSGSAYVFRRSGTAWTEQAILTASDGAGGDLFGHSVSISDETAVVGAFWHDTPAVDAGAAYVFQFSGVRYCTAGMSASGCSAMMSATGTASAAAPSGFVLSATQVEGVKDGIFFYGVNGRQAAPWGTGYQCVLPPVRRAGLMQGVGTGGGCDGTFSLDLNARWTAKPQHNPGAGAVVQAQLWYRDPWNTATSKTTTLSDAIEFMVGP